MGPGRCIPRVCVWGSLILILMAILAARAGAVPSYARQTGLPCSTCHYTPPELTPFGRAFKLNGYTLTAMPEITVPQKKQEGGLTILQHLPLGAMFAIADTVLGRPIPGTQNGTVSMPSELAVYLAGEVTPHVGTFLAVTYTATDNHFMLDMTDIRYARQATLGGKPFAWGATLNNQPTVEDLWNSTPAFGFPWISADGVPAPVATPLIQILGAEQDTAGAGAFAMYANHLYGNFALYRSAHQGGPLPNPGTGFPININNAAPYWRAAWQQPWKTGDWEIGTFGFHATVFPNTVAGPLDHYNDYAADTQFEQLVGKDVITAHASFVYETSHLDATFAAHGADQIPHNVKSEQGDLTYHWGNRYSLTSGFFGIQGTVDPTLYGAGTPIDGSANGNPASNGYIVQGAWWPQQNVQLAVQYTGYWEFNGSKRNYDGAGRNANDNNVLFLHVAFWF